MELKKGSLTVMRLAQHILPILALLTSSMAAAIIAAESPPWVEPMKRVHARFHGTNGTFAQFGDSITITMAFWAPLAGSPKEMNPEMTKALKLVKACQKPECWEKWKGPQFGNNGSMTIRWAYDNVDAWLEKLNPEAAVIMFGDLVFVSGQSFELWQRTVPIIRPTLQDLREVVN